MRSLQIQCYLEFQHDSIIVYNSKSNKWQESPFTYRASDLNWRSSLQPINEKQIEEDNYSHPSLLFEIVKGIWCHHSTCCTMYSAHTVCPNYLLHFKALVIHNWKCLFFVILNAWNATQGNIIYTWYWRCYHTVTHTILPTYYFLFCVLSHRRFPFLCINAWLKGNFVREVQGLL